MDPFFKAKNITPASSGQEWMKELSQKALALQKEIAEEIDNLRIACGWTHSKIAYEAGVVQSTWSKLLKSERPCSLDIIVRFCRVVGLDLKLEVQLVELTQRVTPQSKTTKKTKSPL